MINYKKGIVFRSIIGIVLMLVVSINCYAEDVSVKSVVRINKPDVCRKQGVTYVSATQIFSYLGDTIAWEQEKKQLTVNKGQLVFEVGKKEVQTTKGAFQLKKEVINKEGKVYIPLNFFSDVLGYDVSYKEGIIQMLGSESIGTQGKYEEDIKEKRITISAAGDFTLGYYKGQGSGGRFDEVASQKGYSYFMKGVKSIFQEDDLTIVNLEGPLTTRGVAAEKEFAIRGLPSYTQILTAGSIEAVNLANNHIFDYQRVGYEDTVEALKKSGIDYFGEENICYRAVDGVNIALIGAKGWSNDKSVKEKLKRSITEAKKKADIIIVEFHWGIERENYPNYVQQDLGKYAIDQGAHLVLGSHPHVIQGIGSYKGANIVYSMGNFCFGANRNPDDKDTFIYRQTFIVTDTGVEVEEYEVVPCSISSTSNRNDYQPTVLTGSEKERVLERLKKYSKNLVS